MRFFTTFVKTNPGPRDYPGKTRTTPTTGLGYTTLTTEYHIL